MNFRYAIDPDLQLLTITFSGDVTGKDVIGALSVVNEITRLHPAFRQVWDGLEIVSLDVEYADMTHIVGYIKTELAHMLANLPTVAVLVRRQIDHLIVKTILTMIGSPKPISMLATREAVSGWLAGG